MNTTAGENPDGNLHDLSHKSQSDDRRQQTG